MGHLAAMAAQPFDLIVIGGGINGAATARDAALRGLKTLLIDKGDFGGAVGWSSRLIHGGLRYLEYLEFNLVRESLRERELLLRNAPHLVQPLQMTIPIYRGSKRGPQLVQLGMILYDLLSFDRTVPGHRMLKPAPFGQLFRGVKGDRLTGAAQYFDAQAAHAEQLCLENVLSAQAAGATVLNYSAATRLTQPSQGGLVESLTIENLRSGETVELDTRQAILINTAGPWVDKVLERGWQNGHAQPLSPQRWIGGTKGSHIIVDPFPGAPSGGALYVEAETDGRPYFIIPWLGKYLIGTTDLRTTDAPDDLKASDAEIDYLLAETNRILPQAQLRREDVRFTYSGMRPLPYAKGQKTSSITRSHVVVDHSSAEGGGIRNLISLVGGKLTTYRQVGEELTDAAYRKLGKAVPICTTGDRPLPGAEGLTPDALTQAVQKYRTDAAPDQQLSLATLEHLFNTYGMRAWAVLKLVDEAPDLAQTLQPDLPDIRAQVVYAVETELAQTLVDLGFRRLLTAHRSNYGRDALAATVETLQRHCGWTEAECDRQFQDYRHYVETHALPDYAIAPSATAEMAGAG
ncbi:MAG: glycerol-3-phosphate dehydrogenase/oxidase [Synechococcales cyanobacterium RM1_1_8]|nr:glycerol-3-phosphate dehydrogenase/oxidase [Synechococcales cyanobacterium RM1_1_8]